MATKDTGQPANGISRRAFVTSAAVAATAVGCGFDVAYDAEKALAYENSALHKVTTTTCPYCSASCGQRVVVDVKQWLNAPTNTIPNPDYQKVIDIYGDFESPMNAGGLCAKGAGSIQLVNNTRRIGAWTATHPVNPVFTANTTTYPNGVAYKRTGNGAWGAMDLQAALGEIATGMVTARGALTDVGGYNSKGVAFLGSSHMNNEPNYTYRKLIANFGTSNTEHQARI